MGMAILGKRSIDEAFYNVNELHYSVLAQKALWVWE